LRPEVQKLPDQIGTSVIQIQIPYIINTFTRVIQMAHGIKSIKDTVLTIFNEALLLISEIIEVTNHRLS